MLGHGRVGMLMKSHPFSVVAANRMVFCQEQYDAYLQTSRTANHISTLHIYEQSNKEDGPWSSPPGHSNEVMLEGGWQCSPSAE